MIRLSLACLSSLILLAACDTASEADNQSDSENAVPAAGGEGPPVLQGQIMRTFAGTELPDFTFSNPQGETLERASLEGTPVLVNLWATWCVPCRREMPLLDNLADELGDDVRVLTISQDVGKDTPKVVEFFEEGGFRNLEKWLDPDQKLGLQFAQAGMPTTILFDGEGKELLRVAGDYEWDSEDAIAAIREAIAE